LSIYLFIEFWRKEYFCEIELKLHFRDSERIVDGRDLVYRKWDMKMFAHDVLFNVLICYPSY